MPADRVSDAQFVKALLLTLLAAGTGCVPACFAQEAAGNDASPTAPAAAAAFPKRPVEMAPSAPQVTCRGQEMTIHAENSTMGSVLFAIGSCIGLRIEVPEGTSNERTYVQLGPGPTLEVLQSLLSSTEYNYVIEPSDSDPGKIQSVLLMARPKDEKQSGASGDLAMTPARRAWLEMRKHQRPADSAEEGSNTSSESASASASDAPVAASSTEASGASSTPLAAAGPAPASAANPSNPGATAAVSPSATIPASSATPAVAADPAALIAASATPAAASDQPAQPAPASASADNAASAASSGNAANAEVSPSGANREMQDRISNMQQLFEQRKQMIQQGQQANQPPQ